LPLKALGSKHKHGITVTDLITGNSYIWDKEWNFVELHPALPFHLFKIH
jgi:starch synthase (maltosyl-transferring)